MWLDMHKTRHPRMKIQTSFDFRQNHTKAALCIQSKKGRHYTAVADRAYFPSLIRLSEKYASCTLHAFEQDSDVQELWSYAINPIQAFSRLIRWQGFGFSAGRGGTPAVFSLRMTEWTNRAPTEFPVFAQFIWEPEGGSELVWNQRMGRTTTC